MKYSTAACSSQPRWDTKSSRRSKISGRGVRMIARLCTLTVLVPCKTACFSLRAVAVGEDLAAGDWLSARNQRGQASV